MRVEHTSNTKHRHITTHINTKGTDTMQQAKTIKLPSLTIYNDTGKALPLSLWSILRQATKRGYSAFPSLIQDPVSTRAERTRKGLAVEVEIYGDGSGLEVALRGRLFIFGVEAKHCLAQALG